MEHYVGLDVSLKRTSICVVNHTGSVVREGVVDSDPEAIASFVRSNAPGAVRIGLETGAISVDGFQKMVERLSDKAKLGFQVHPHMLRHACTAVNANL
jgi:integrase